MNLIQWKNNSPISTRFDDIYFNPESGIEESKYVFIDGNDLSLRWEHCQTDQIFNICETGYGTGLNMLNTQSFFQNYRHRGAIVHYYSCELYPVNNPDIQRALSKYPELRSINDQIMEKYNPLQRGWQIIANPHNNFVLHLYIGDVNDMLQQMIHYEIQIDAWFLDGFSPANNPEMWSVDVCNSAALLSRKKATLSSFTSAGFVRRNLQAAGFSIKKVSGFGKKREMITGHLL